MENSPTLHKYVKSSPTEISSPTKNIPEIQSNIHLPIIYLTRLAISLINTKFRKSYFRKFAAANIYCKNYFSVRTVRKFMVHGDRMVKIAVLVCNFKFWDCVLFNSEKSVSLSFVTLIN